MVKFFISIFIVSVIIAGLTFLGSSQGLFYMPSFFLQTLLFLLFSTGLIYVYLYKANKPDFFLQLYLLTMAVKLLAYCAYNLVIILYDKPGAISNVVFFMATYFIFTALEVGSLYRKISGENKS